MTRNPLRLSNAGRHWGKKETMYLSAINVKPLENYGIEPTFENHEVKIFDVKNYLETGIFRKLKDRKLFNRVKVSFDSVEWPGGIDLDTEILYKKSKTKEELLCRCPNAV